MQNNVHVSSRISGTKITTSEDGLQNLNNFGNESTDPNITTVT